MNEVEINYTEHMAGSSFWRRLITVIVNEKLNGGNKLGIRDLRAIRKSKNIHIKSSM